MVPVSTSPGPERKLVPSTEMSWEMIHDPLEELAYVTSPMYFELSTDQLSLSVLYKWRHQKREQTSTECEGSCGTGGRDERKSDTYDIVFD